MIIFSIPAYNEEKNIGLLIDEINAYAKREALDYRLIVVDDGSADKTAEIVRQKSLTTPCEVISYQPNKGVAEAFRQGFKRALEIAKDSDIIVTSEADRTADLEILKSFTEKIKGGLDLVVASYYMEGGGFESTVWYRKVTSRCANWLVSTVSGIRTVHTYSSFYRAYRPRLLRGILQHYGDFYRSPGFPCVVEILVRAHRLKFRIGETPMILRGGRRVDKSKMKVFQTILEYFRISFRIIVGNF